MEILVEIGKSILSAIGGELMKSAACGVKYIFHFKGTIEDLSEEAKNLRLRLEAMQHRIDRAKAKTEEIEENVQRWVKDVGDVLADVENTERESKEKDKFLYGWCPNWKQRYQLAKYAEKKKAKVLKLVDEDKFEIISHRAPLSGIDFDSPEGFVPYKSNQPTYERVMEALRDDEANLVGLYGMGGVGKTTLAKAVASRTKQDNIFKNVLMVAVSRYPNIRNIQGQIADLFSFELKEESEQGRAERLTKRLISEKEKTLIILDDVWAKLDLKSVGIPVEHCKVFLTTRLRQVCIDMGCQLWIPLEVLSGGEGLLLLKRQVGLKDDCTTFNELAEEVANECKGLPLAIVTVGSTLREKPADEWKVMIQKLKKSALVNMENVEVKVYEIIKWSYDYLKRKETKLCFLLCSMFPEDHKIDIEELFRYGYGLGWYQDTDSIEDARRELNATVNNLTASSLLMDAGTGFVKMHDIVRDVALWIASEGEHVFLVKAGLGLTEWPKHRCLEQCTAISLIGNNIKVLPDDVVCASLQILLVGSLSSHYARLEVGERFFEEMKYLKVVTFLKVKLSVKPLESLASLVTLQLIGCRLQDISSLGKLAQLKILSLQNSIFDESFAELKELNQLRMLDLRDCYLTLERISAAAIPELCRLEQLYIGCDSRTPKVEGNATLFDLNKLPNLAMLSIKLNESSLPKDFYVVKSLHSYEIKVNQKFSLRSFPFQRTLSIKQVKGDSLFAFGSLYKSVEYLDLKDIDGCPRNIVPIMDQTGLTKLISLDLSYVDGLDCIIDMTQQHAPSAVLSHLMHLHLFKVQHLSEFCKGNPPDRFLRNLEVLLVKYCNKLTSCVVPERLEKLKDVTIIGCDNLPYVFQLEGMAKENPCSLASLSYLGLSFLPELRDIWKGSMLQLTLKSLTTVSVYECEKLRYIFTLNIARSLAQLRSLSISTCKDLKHIVEIKTDESRHLNEAARNGNDVVLPNLQTLTLLRLNSLINFCSGGHNSTWPAVHIHLLFPSLIKLEVRDCPQIATEFSVDGNGSVHCQAEVLAHIAEQPVIE